MPATLETEWVPENVSNTPFIHDSPLPRLTPLPSPLPSGKKQYEVLVIGAGPAGLMLTTLLTRYGLSSSSLLCIDQREHQTLVGNADSVLARTLEIFAQLGLESRFRRHGGTFSESTVWGRDDENPDQLVKRMAMPFFMGPARFEQIICLGQGHVEEVLREDVKRYGGNDVQYSSTLVDLKVDEEENAEFPVLATVERGGVKEEVRAKYVIGADGAKSSVRGFMGVEIEGEPTDELWGVIDLVVDSDFPDVRRLSSISSLTVDKGNELSGGVNGGFIVPRERLANGEFLTRLYLDMTVKDEETKEIEGHGDTTAEDQQHATRKKQNRITEELILQRAAELFRPFNFKVKQGTQVKWWAAFRIAQRLTKSFIVKDSKSHPRVIIVGDACHSHSPRQGQGQNVSIQDSHNLAWKLAYTLFGLNSQDDPAHLLKNYEEERLPNAKALIAFDKASNEPGLTREEKWTELRKFIAGNGIEYKNSYCVSIDGLRNGQNWTDEDWISGVIRPSQRLLNVKLKRFADGNTRDIHDELGGDGRFSIVVLAASDFGTKDSQSNKITDLVCGDIIHRFPDGTVRPIVVQPATVPKFDWVDLPPSVKQNAEMRVFNGGTEVYKTYGVESEGEGAGALVVVRPDGIVGLITRLDGEKAVSELLQRILKTN